MMTSRCRTFLISLFCQNMCMVFFLLDIEWLLDASVLDSLRKKGEGEQNSWPQNVPLLRVDYFNLKTIKSQ